MILFVADYPRAENEKDGMMQRIAAVDERFSTVERCYLKVSFVKFIRGEKEKPSELLTIYRLNFFLHFLLILYLGFRARSIYVHSIGNAIGVLPLYLLGKCITDMHGVVADEFRLAGRRLAAWRYDYVESFVASRSRFIVTVSTEMAEHFRKKYGIDEARTVNVPIFDDADSCDAGRRAADAVPTVIYAGGTQAWQNVDMMTSAMGKMADRYRFVILTGDVASFQAKLSTYPSLRAVIKCVPKSEVYCYYGQADLGFVLRDDNLVNRVACPTKLVEYLSCGVIPIVIQPLIGDFDRYGYAYLTLSDFTSGAIPSADALQSMREKNFQVITTMKNAALSEMQRLVALCAGGVEQVRHGA